MVSVAVLIKSSCSALLFPGAIAAKAADGDIIMLYLEAVGHNYSASRGVGGEVNVKNPAAFIAIEMAMLLHVGAVAGGGAVEIDVADEAALDQGVEAIVDRGHRDFRHALFGPQEDVLDLWMVALLQQH